MQTASAVPRLMDVNELANLWRVSPHTIRAWVQQKRLNPTKICRRFSFTPMSAPASWLLETVKLSARLNEYRSRLNTAEQRSRLAPLRGYFSDSNARFILRGSSARPS